MQQINNQITSLQNQAQSLINQARNLANLPFSSLQQLQQSIQRTQQLLNQAQRIAAVGLVVLIVALTIAQSQHSEQAVVLAPLEHRDAETLVEELARCRTITSDETAVLEACRRTWAENRRQFFGSATSSQSPADPVLKAPAAPVKNQDRVVPREVEPQQGEAR